MPNDKNKSESTSNRYTHYDYAGGRKDKQMKPSQPAGTSSGKNNPKPKDKKK